MGESKRLLVYLIGSMEYAKRAGIDWRVRYRDELKKLNIDAILPNEQEKDIITQNNLNEVKKSNPEEYKSIMRKLIELDLGFVEQADFLICRWEGETISGTVHEVGHAYVIGTPSYLVTSKEFHEIPGWFASCFTKIFPTMTALLDFLKKE